MKKSIVELGLQLYNGRFVVAENGNISVKLDDGRVLITRSGCRLGNLSNEDIVLVDSDGNRLSGGRPTSEIALHLEIYRRRADVRAVVHAHPPWVVICSLCGIDLTEPVLPEVLMTLGRIPTARFAVPSSVESAEVVRPLISDHDVVVLDRHGAVTVGSTLEDAFSKLERLEFAARVMYHAEILGKVEVLTDEEIARIEKSTGRYRNNRT